MVDLFYGGLVAAFVAAPSSRIGAEGCPSRPRMYPTIVPNNPNAGATCSLLYPADIRINVPVMIVTTTTGRVTSSGRTFGIRRNVKIMVVMTTKPKIPIIRVNQNSYGVLAEKKLSIFSPADGFALTGGGDVGCSCANAGERSNNVAKTSPAKRGPGPMALPWNFESCHFKV